MTARCRRAAPAARFARAARRRCRLSRRSSWFAARARWRWRCSCICWLAAPARRARAAALGFAFGLGLFLAGVSWVYVSLHDFGAMPAPLAALRHARSSAPFSRSIPALAGCAAGDAPRAARGARRAASSRRCGRSPNGCAAGSSPAFPGSRSATRRRSTRRSRASRPLGGVYGVVASSPRLRRRAAAGASRIGAGALARRPRPSRSLGVAGAGLRRCRVDRAGGRAGHGRACCRATSPQDLKCDPARYARTLEHLRAARRAQPRAAHRAARDRAAALSRQRRPGLPRAPARGARSATAATCCSACPTRAAPRATTTTACVSLGASPPQRYHKSHLVPFGEFVPPGFGWIVRVLRSRSPDFARGAPTQRPLAVAGQRVAVNICYEDAFGEEIIRQLPRGDAAGERVQRRLVRRLARAARSTCRSRARARSRPGACMLRATNTGITAIDRPRRRACWRGCRRSPRAPRRRGAGLCRRHALRALRRLAGARRCARCCCSPRRCVRAARGASR